MAMATATITAPKVRLVRCPKCLLVLPEVEDFPVYKCGGCDTILVAKNRKPIAKNTSVLQEIEAAAANESVRVLEHGESSGSSSLQDVLPSRPESRTSRESGGQSNGRYTSRDSDGDGACAMLDENRSSGSHSEEHGEGLSVEGEPNGCFEKDRNASTDGESDRDLLDENRSIGSRSNENDGDLSLEGASDSDVDVDGASEGDMVDENRSNEGQQDGTGMLQTESLEHSNGSLWNEFHHDQNEGLKLAAESNFEAEANGKNLRSGSANSELETSNKVGSNTIGSRRGERRGVSSVRSTDTFDNVDFVSLGYEFSEPTECLSKSTTVRSSRAYDSSISSFDGMDNHFPDQQLHSLHDYEGAHPSRESRIRPLEPPRDRQRVEKDQYLSSIPLPPRARKHPSSIPLPERVSLHGNESAGPSRESRDRVKRDQHLSQIPLTRRAALRGNESASPSRELRDQYPSSVQFPQWTSLRGNESAGPSRELRDELPFGSALDRFKKAEYDDEENVKLLRMVYELQDQISKTCNLNENTNARTRIDVPWKKSNFDAYNHQEEPPEDDSFHPSYYGRHGLSPRTRFSRVPFSRGEINSRYGIDNTCSCCHPEQLHPPMFPHNRGFCRGGTDHSCYNSYSSCPSSPQRNLESGFSNDQSYREHEMKTYLREKHHAARRHIRPTAGGAPFVTCYHCIKPLQLPADFLLFKRRFHQLRCGGCSKVLKFSLRNQTQIVPYELVVEAPPPSKVEDRGDARISAFASPSDASTETDPSSYTDEYGHSFDISCSTEGNPLSAGPSRSKKASSEFEGSPWRTRVSPLHRLMGYSTLSQVLGRRRPSISDTSSNQSGKN